MPVPIDRENSEISDIVKLPSCYDSFLQDRKPIWHVHWRSGAHRRLRIVLVGTYGFDRLDLQVPINKHAND